MPVPGRGRTARGAESATPVSAPAASPKRWAEKSTSGPPEPSMARIARPAPRATQAPRPGAASRCRCQAASPASTPTRPKTAVEAPRELWADP
jgi:hypothetical protein